MTSPTPTQEAILLRILEMLEALVAIQRVQGGPAVDDAGLRRRGVDLRDPMAPAEVFPPRSYPVGSLIRFRGTAQTLLIANMHSSAIVTVRLYGPRLPGLGAAFDSVPLSPPISISAMTAIEDEQAWCQGLFLPTGADHLQVIAR